MKNTIKFLCIFLFVMVSCTNKDIVEVYDNEVSSKASYVSEQTTDISNLLVSYAIYEVAENNWKFIDGKVKQTNKVINFVNKEHKNLVVCIWVDNSSIYEFNFDDAIITANYDNVSCIENNEAYFAVLNSNDDINIDVKALHLNSPFTIVNLRANDLEDAKIAGLQNSDIKFVIKRYSKFSFKTLDVYDEVISCGKFNVNDIHNNVINKLYCFATKDKSSDNSIKISFSNYDKVLYNIPFERGSNLIINGDFLTSAINMNIKIIPDFSGNL